MYRKIMVPLDGSPFGECALAHVIDIGTGCQVPIITLFTVLESQNFPDVVNDESTKGLKAEEKAKKYLDETAAKLQKEGLNTEIVIDKGSAAEKILDYVEKNDVDLIIISTHGSSGISRWLTGSTADKVIRHAAIPVLAVSPEGCRI